MSPRIRSIVDAAIYLACGAFVLGGCAIVGLGAGYAVLMTTADAYASLLSAGAAGAYTLYAASRAVRGP